jgi:hypothetical protein
MNGLQSLMTGLALVTRLIHYQTLQMEHGILSLLMAIHMPDLPQMLPIPILCKMSTMEKSVFILLDLTQPGSLTQITFSQFKIALK